MLTWCATFGARNAFFNIKKVRKFEVWEAADAERRNKSKAIRGGRKEGGGGGRRSAVADDRNVLPEVKALEDFMAATGGRMGGWSTYDHGIFMKHRGQHRNPNEAVMATADALVGKTVADTMAHEDWYEEYLEMVETRKVAIAEWKDAKRAADELAKRDQQSQTAARLAADEMQRKAKELKRQKATAAKASEVKQWREAQRFRAAAVANARAAEHEAVAAAQKERDRQRHAAAKAKVNKFAEAKRQERELLAAAAAARAARAVKTTEADLAHFRDRDRRAFAEQVARRKQKATEDAERLANLEKMKKKVKVKRDPSRLYAPTAASRNRAADKSGSGMFGGQIISRAPPRRAVPTWRQGM